MGFKKVRPYPGMVITESVEFEKGEYDFFGKDGIIIGADNITIEGNGAWLKGGHEKGETQVHGNTDEFGYQNTGSPDNAKELGYYGIGVYAEGKNGVTIKNLRISGFDIGFHAKNSKGFVVDNCDFSDCFSDPAWGWDDHGFHGGILLEHMNDCLIQNCKATNVWDGLNMRFSNNNRVLGNNFSHTSNTGLRMWNSCSNEICDNDFSYGLRISPGEVHARDSSGVLIESGSNNNVFKRNDMTHGGDGLFIRVLNGWMSTGNYFEENDCSYANNNAIEAWADGNTYVRNKVNYSSYGFWLGGSDNTILIGNEVAYNGTVFKNAPESFGNAGIAVVNGSGSHIVMEDNYIHDNCGPGIAIRFNKDYPSFHWVIQGNRIENNKSTGKYKGHGIYIKNARWITFGQNTIKGNEGEPIFFDSNTSDIVFLKGSSPDKKVEAKFDISSQTVFVGDEVIFDASASSSDEGKLRYRWDLGDGTVEMGRCVKHIYKEPGFYRMGLTVDNGTRAALAFRNIYVLPSRDIFGTNDEVSEWRVSGNGQSYKVTRDSNWTVSGQGSICIEAGVGTRHTLKYPASRQLGLNIGMYRILNFYLRYVTDSDPDWQRSLKFPAITLYADDQNYVELVPENGIMERLFVKNNEEKDNWQLVSIDIDGGDGWAKRIVGDGIAKGIINLIKIEYGNTNPGISRLWLDGFCFTNKNQGDMQALDIALNKYKSEYPMPFFSSHAGHSDPYAPISGNARVFGDGTPRFATALPDEGFYGVEFGCLREFDRVDLYFYHNLTETINARGEAVPEESWLEVKADGLWREVPGTRTSPARGHNVFTFDPVLADSVRVRFKCSDGHIASLYAFSVYNTCNAIKPFGRGINAKLWSNRDSPLVVEAFEVKLNKEINGNGVPLGDLMAQVFEIDDSGKLTNCLFETIVPKDDIIPYAVTRIDAGLGGLESGRKYALALGQTSLAESRTVGDYYRWIAGKTGFDETFAIYDNGQTEPSDYDWGTAYLRVLCNGLVADYSNESEHIGTRFGIKGMEYRYMTFTMPDAVSTLADGIAAGDAGWIAQGEESEVHITFTEELHINGANIWIDGDSPGEIQVLCGERIVAKIEKPGMGIVRFEFETVKNRAFSVRIRPGVSKKTVLKEIELKSPKYSS